MLLAHLVSGRYGAHGDEPRVEIGAKTPRWYARLVAFLLDRKAK